MTRKISHHFSLVRLQRGAFEVDKEVFRFLFSINIPERLAEDEKF